MLAHRSLIVLGLICVTVVTINRTLAEEPTLKDTFAKDFKVGVALGTQQVMGQEPAAIDLAKKQFNSTTPENLLKWESVHPSPDEYNFEPVDRYVEFGEKNGMFIVGHCLIWHNQTPGWVFVDDSGKPLDREALLARMKDHIQTVVGRYKGRIKGWDVVNEAIMEDGSMRKSKWQQIIGDDFIDKAFQFAHEADPDAELYYNEYHEWKPKTITGIARLINDLKAKGVPIHGLGLQGHWQMKEPKAAEIENMLGEYEKLGVKLMITELDINTLPQIGPAILAGTFNSENPAGVIGDDAAVATDPDAAAAKAKAEQEAKAERQKLIDPYPNGLPPEMQKALADRYAEIFKIFLKHRDSIDRVTFWGVQDGQSWHNYHRRVIRTSYPLLFDRQYQPKLAFEAVIQVAEQQ